MKHFSISKTLRRTLFLTAFMVAAATSAHAQTITTANPLPDAQVGETYSITLEQEGLLTNIEWDILSGDLPAGLELSSAGVISGTPTAAGIKTFTVEVTGRIKGPTVMSILK